VSDIAITTTATTTVHKPRKPRPRPEIKLPNGDFLVPRVDFASELGVCEKTVVRMNLPTTYLGTVAYIQHNASLEVIASTVRRRNEPAARSNPRKHRRAVNRFCKEVA
jgi:hypothetical protein